MLNVEEDLMSSADDLLDRSYWCFTHFHCEITYGLWTYNLAYYAIIIEWGCKVEEYILYDRIWSHNHACTSMCKQILQVQIDRNMFCDLCV